MIDDSNLFECLDRDVNSTLLPLFNELLSCYRHAHDQRIDIQRTKYRNKFVRVRQKFRFGIEYVLASYEDFTLPLPSESKFGSEKWDIGVTNSSLSWQWSDPEDKVGCYTIQWSATLLDPDVFGSSAVPLTSASGTTSHVWQKTAAGLVPVALEDCPVDVIDLLEVLDASRTYRVRVAMLMLAWVNELKYVYQFEIRTRQVPSSDYLRLARAVEQTATLFSIISEIERREDCEHVFAMIYKDLKVLSNQPRPPSSVAAFQDFQRKVDALLFVVSS